MSTLQAVYFRAADGSEPVLEFLAGLDAKPRAALMRQIDRLNDLSDAVPPRRVQPVGMPLEAPGHC